MNNQDIDGHVPPEAPPATPGAPDSLEQQLDKEREARALMRDRLRHTEALAAESHALRARMAEELERVTADRDRLRAEAAAASQAAAPGETTVPLATLRASEPLFTPTMSAVPPPHVADRPLKPPPAPRKGPWASLAMLGVLAVLVAAGAWYKRWLPDDRDAPLAATPAATAPVDAAGRQAAPPIVAAAPPAASATVATAAPSTGTVALPPLSPEAQLAAAPSAAGPTTTTSPSADAAGLPLRLRKALDGEGIASTVGIDAASGHVQVADAQNDDALRQRTDMVIRAVYAGASLPEPQIEHHWLSPMRGAHETTAAADASTATPPATPARADRHKDKPTATPTAVAAVASLDALTPVVPAGRITAGCMQDLAGRSSVHRSNMTACMKNSCCSSAANHNSEECRAYDKAYPFTCGAG